MVWLPCSDLIPVGLTQSAPIGSTPLPLPKPITGVLELEAFRRIVAKVDWVVQQRPTTADAAPWAHITDYNLKCTAVQLGENVGDALLEPILHYEVWRQRGLNRTAHHVRTLLLSLPVAPKSDALGWTSSLGNPAISCFEQSAGCDHPFAPD